MGVHLPDSFSLILLLVLNGIPTNRTRKRANRRAQSSRRNQSRNTMRAGGVYATTSNVERYPLLSPTRQNLGGFPIEQHVLMRYVDVISLNPSVTTDSHVFAVTSLFDPDFTGSGHQPSNFDTWSRIYRRYCVTGVRVAVSYAAIGPDIVPCQAGLIFDTSGNQVTSSTDPNSLWEQPYAMKFTNSVGIGDGYDPGQLRCRVNTAEWFGVSRREMLADDELCSSFSGGPTRPLFMELWAAPVGLNSPSNDITFRVELTFECTLTDPQLTTFS